MTARYRGRIAVNYISRMIEIKIKLAGRLTGTADDVLMIAQEGQLMPEFDLLAAAGGRSCSGTALLVATVVGSGIMAETLTRDVALAAARQHAADRRHPRGADHHPRADLGRAFQSGGHAGDGAKGDLPAREAARYVAVQMCGGIAGTVIAHAMFGMPLFDFSMKVRTGSAQWLAEAVAAFGLVATILAGVRFNRPAVPWLVGLYITAAYWFTASTSFANPAVAIARSLTNTFSGIRPDRSSWLHRKRTCRRRDRTDADGLVAAWCK